MDTHLNDEQWAAAVLNQSDAAAAEHMAACPACRLEVNAFAAAAGVAQAQTRQTMDQPESFWRRQQQGVTARLAARDFVHPWKRWTWVAATVTLILLATSLLSRHKAPPVQTAAQTDPDDVLLLSVQQSIRSDLPQALQPAALLTQEIDRAEVPQRGR